MFRWTAWMEGFDEPVVMRVGKIVAGGMSEIGPGVELRSGETIGGREPTN